MSYLLEIGLLALLAFMAYEDFRYRGIQWWSFPALALFSFSLTFYTSGEWAFLTDTIYSLLLLTLLLVVSGAVYFLIRRNNPIQSLGIGDVLFFIGIVPLFNTFEYFYFLSGTFVVIAIVHAIISRYLKEKTIPLAGYQSIFLIGYLVFKPNWFSEPFNLHFLIHN